MGIYLQTSLQGFPPHPPAGWDPSRASGHPGTLPPCLSPGPEEPPWPRLSSGLSQCAASPCLHLPFKFFIWRTGRGRYGNIDVSGKYFKEMVAGRLGEDASRMWRTQRLWEGVRFGDLAPIPQGSGDSPFPGRGLCGSSPRRPVPGSQRLPTPTRGLSHPPPLSQQCTLCLLLFSLCISRPPPGKSLQAGSLAGTCCAPCGCQRHHALSPPGLLCQGQATRGRGTRQGCPSPCIPPPLAYHPCPPGTAPQQGGGQSPDW